MTNTKGTKVPTWEQQEFKVIIASLEIFTKEVSLWHKMKIKHKHQ
jgi:hypothetical protein